MTRCITENFVKKLFGEKDVEAVLQRLNRLTQEEAKLTAAKTLEVVYGLVQNLRVVTDGEQIYEPCHSLGVEYHSFQMAKHRSTVSRMPSVCYWGLNESIRCLTEDQKSYNKLQATLTSRIVS
jgi:hypothetical protein